MFDSPTASAPAPRLFWFLISNALRLAIVAIATAGFVAGCALMLEVMK
jgi:hypothetical protein